MKFDLHISANYACFTRKAKSWLLPVTIMQPRWVIIAVTDHIAHTHALSKCFGNLFFYHVSVLGALCCVQSFLGGQNAEKCGVS